MSGYWAALFTAVGAFIRLHPTAPVAYLLAIAPSVPVIASIVVMGLYLVEETDEFERSIQMQSALWALAGALAVATAWSFLEMWGLAPHVWSWAMYPLWAALLGPAQVIARRRYR